MKTTSRPQLVVIAILLLINLCAVQGLANRTGDQPASQRGWQAFGNSRHVAWFSVANFLQDEGWDVRVTKSVNSDTTTPGSNLTYTIHAINDGPNPSDTATLSDNVPANTTFVSFTSPVSWSCSTPSAGGTGLISCTNPSLPAGSDDVFTLVVHVDLATPPNTFISNLVSIATNTPDISDENNSASASSFVPGQSAELGVDKSTNDSTVFANSDVTYSIVVTNSGPDPAVNATMNDTLPGNMVFVSYSAPAGWVCTPPSVGNGGTLSCVKSSLAVTAGETITLVGHVPSNTPPTTYNNIATISSATDDFNSGNNSSVAVTDVVDCFVTPTVTSNGDSGPGTLRDALAKVCNGGTVYFSPSLVSPIILSTGELAIAKNVTIQGPGAGVLTVQRSGAAVQFPVFHVLSGQTATIDGLTISGGAATDGGGIHNEGGLTVSNSTVSSNTAFHGGGIANKGTLMLNDSTISGNSVSGGGSSGGGLYAPGPGQTIVTRSTISGNTTDTIAGRRGGGIHLAGPVTITNSTISGNTSSAGSGIYNDIGGNLTATNVTISSNITTVSGGGGVFVESGSTTTLRNTIIANTAGDNDLAGTGIVASTFGIIEAPGAVAITGSPNVTGTDPKLGLLASNGGPTQTHALLAGSVALDTGDNSLAIAASLITDQRGGDFLRIRDAADPDTTQTVDIGAFEADPSVEDITDKLTVEETPTSFSFNVGDAQTSFSSIVATSGNPTLVPNSNLVITGSGSTRTLTITPAANQSGTATITVTATKVISGSTVSMSDTFVLTVSGVNDAPVNNVPGPQTMNENGTLVFSAANGNQISISDSDAGSNPVHVNLISTNGRMTLSGTAGLTFTPVDPTNDGSADVIMNFSGTLANINAALNGMSFVVAPGYDGQATIQIVTDDLGNSGTGGSLSDNDTINITVNDGGVLAFSSTTYSVSESGPTAIITVSRGGGTSGEARVNYSTSDGTATAGQDYTATSGQLIFANGVTSQTFAVPITNDTTSEASETINLALSNATGTGALGSPSTAVLTITDNDPLPSLSIGDVSLNEGNSATTSFNFQVSLSAASAQTITVNYQTANGTATAPGDYTALTTTSLTFSPGQTSKTVSVLVNGDTTFEGDETFFVNLSGASNATISDSQGLGTIINDDSPGVQLSSPAYSVNEQDSFATITVNRVGDLSQPLTVDYSTSDTSGLNSCNQVTGNASQRCDYATVVGILRFASGEASKTIIIPIIDDVHIEGPESFAISLTNPTGGSLVIPTPSSVTIIDNDVAPAPNPIDNDAFFIRELYIDLLGRLPEPGAVNNWLAILNHCPNPSDPVNGCDRIAVAAGFLNSAEFQGRGYFVYRHYSAALGRIPLYGEFIPDMALVNGFLSTSDLEANKVAYTNILMNRTEFKAIYDPTIGNPTAYVDTLISRAGLAGHPQRASWIAALTNGSLTRAQVLRQFIDSNEVYNKFVRQAFVIMNYFGFLRRSADSAFQGWIDLYNSTNNPRLVINGFINSAEYRLRFGP